MKEVTVEITNESGLHARPNRTQYTIINAKSDVQIDNRLKKW